MKEDEKGGAVGLKAYANGVLIGKSGEQAVLSKSWNRGNYNIKMDLKAYQVVESAVAQWLRCCATNRKVASSIPAGVIGIFH